ncbi:MAG: cytochrome c maturation protein CcmE [Myxococcales bacterium]|nr:cytochrome c maturation protein CcmE [Myxococcales bacterium]
MSKGVQITIAALSICAGTFWFLSSGSGGEGTFAYYQSVRDFAQKVDASAYSDGAASGRAARVHGFVVEGSIRKDLGAGHVDFEIRDEMEGTPGAPALSVRLIGIAVPDLFADGAEVVVEGRPDGQRFVARRVLAKCPSKYEPGDPATDGRKV